MNSTTVPILRYNDAQKAIDWLCKAFGFEVYLLLPAKESGKIDHCRLVRGSSMIMVASFNQEEEFEKRFISPQRCGGVTQCTSLVVDNPEELFQSALAAKANIIDEIASLPFGGKTFTCEDFESHVWVISSHDPWHKAWEVA